MMEVIEAKATFKKYSAYKDSGVEWLGEIPDHWELTRLGSYFQERKTKVSDKDFAALSVTKQGILPQLETAAKTNDGDNRKLVKKGDFVINSRSDRKGSSGIAKEDGSVSLINIVMKPISIHPTYCNYLLKSNAFVEENYRIGHGIVADLWTTRYDEMKNIKIGIPTPEEQTAIASFLDDKTAKIDHVITQKEKLINLLKERKQIIIQDLVTGKKVWNPSQNAWTKPAEVKDSGVEWIGEIPVGWEVRRLKAEIDLLTGYPFPSSKYSDHGIKLARGINVKEGEFNWDDLRCWPQITSDIGKYQLEGGDILIAMDGSKVGKNFCQVKSADLPILLLQRVARLRPRASLDKDYLYWNIANRSFLDWVNISKTDPMVPHIAPKDICGFIIPLPPVDYQNIITSKISEEIRKIEEAIALQQGQIEKMKEYKATLIDSAVTGKIKVTGI